MDLDDWRVTPKKVEGGSIHGVRRRLLACSVVDVERVVLFGQRAIGGEGRDHPCLVAQPLECGAHLLGGVLWACRRGSLSEPVTDDGLSGRRVG